MPPDNRACFFIARKSLLAACMLISSIHAFGQEDYKWHYGAFFTGGFPPDYQIHTPRSHSEVDVRLLSAGIDGGMILTAPHGPGILRGRGEAGIELLPFWLAQYPRQTRTIHFYNGNVRETEWGPYNVVGASITPFLLRWNFVSLQTRKQSPWIQMGGGLLWTDRKFPLLGGSTSAINFTPQVDIGDSLSFKRGQTLDLAVKAIHISNAGLGNSNPGMNVTLQFSNGYSWWKYRR